MVTYLSRTAYSFRWPIAAVWFALITLSALTVGFAVIGAAIGLFVVELRTVATSTEADDLHAVGQRRSDEHAAVSERRTRRRQCFDVSWHQVDAVAVIARDLACRIVERSKRRIGVVAVAGTVGSGDAVDEEYVAGANVFAVDRENAARLLADEKFCASH